MEEKFDNEKVKLVVSVASEVLSGGDYVALYDNLYLFKECPEVFWELFPFIVARYDKDNASYDLVDPNLKQLTEFVRTCFITRDNIASVLQLIDEVEYRRARLALTLFLLKVFPKYSGADDDFKEVCMSSVLRFLEKSRKDKAIDETLNRIYFDDLENEYLIDEPCMKRHSDLIPEIIIQFLGVFRSCVISNYTALDRLMKGIILRSPIPSVQMHQVMSMAHNLFMEIGYQMPITAAVYASDLSATLPILPRIFSAEHRLRMSMRGLTMSLGITSTSIYTVGYVALVLRNYLLPIPIHSISRHDLNHYTRFCELFLVCCETQTLSSLREVCMELFTKLLSKFEPVGQVIMLRTLLRGVIAQQLELSCETQILAWLLDIYRHELYNSPAFLNELSYLWGDIVDLHYSRPAEAMQYYTAVCSFARFQALIKVKPTVLLAVYKKILLPLQAQVADLTKLLDVQDRVSTESKTEVSAQDIQYQIEKSIDMSALPLLQFIVSDTLSTVVQYLSGGGYLS